jgi:hypothetical protein
MDLLVITQQSRHKFIRNASMFKLSTKMHWTVPYNSPTISQTSCIVRIQSARIALWTFATISGVICRWSARTLIVVNRCSSVLEAFVP